MDEQLREKAVHGRPGFPFALYHMRYLPHPRSFPLHWHEEVELIYVEQGELTLTIGRQTMLGHAGDLFVVNARQIHSMSVGQIHTEYVTVLFPLSSLMLRSADETAEEYLLPLEAGELWFPTCVRETAAYVQMKEKMEEMVQVYHNKPKAYPLTLRLLLMEMVLVCHRFDCFAAGNAGAGYSSREREILGFIRSRCRTDLTLDTAAGELHMSAKYFSRYFRKTFGVTFTDYLTHLRLEASLELLHNTAQSVSEIALQSGFNSSSYYNKKFREVYGKTPTEYRSALRLERQRG